MANLAVISMNAGKITPLIDARSDTEKFSSGCRELQNMIPLIYGPVTRRPGTKKIADCSDHDVVHNAVSFRYSSTISYKLIFGEKRIDIYFEETYITGVTTPYTEAELFQIQVEQSADVMWIVHPSHRPRKLSRTAVDTFSLDVITYENGPFRKRNDLDAEDGVTIAVTGYTVATATAGAKNTGNFTMTSATDISSLFPPNKRFYITNSTGNDTAYTTHDSTTTYVTDYTGTTLTIYTNETVADGTDDGQIMVDGGTVTLTASAATFNADGDHNNALFKLTHKREQSSIVGTATATEVIGSAIDVKGAWTLTSDGNWGGEFEIQRLADGTNWETFRTYASQYSAG